MADPAAKILIVDDNDLIRSLLRGILRNEDYEIVGEAWNGVVALEAIERDKPDIVFLDVMMPEMDGLDTLQCIKATYPGVLVIMITGNPSVDNVQESIRRGAEGFIIKPFNSARVIDTVRRVWQARPASPASAAA